MPSIPDELLTQIQRAGWVEVAEIGSGGGGRVYRCISQKLIESVRPFLTTPSREPYPNQVTAPQIDSLFQLLYSVNQEIVALKIPHDIEDSHTRKRMKREIEGMKSINHPAIINLIDADNSENPQWFVMDYHHKGILTDYVSQYEGKPLETLHAIRPIAEGLGQLHKQGLVHRDIKPGNIFIASDGRLVLGDFGIIFTKEEDRTRLTNPEELEGSRDWIPDWVRHHGWEKMTEIADIHMLAKVMYFMVSGGKKVASSQIVTPHSNLATLYPNNNGIHLIYQFLIRCITNNEEDCRFRNADSFLKGIDELIVQLTRNRIPQLLFSIFEPNFPNQFPIPMTGGYGFNEILSTKILIPDGFQRFRGMARVGNSSHSLKGSLKFVLKTQTDQKESCEINLNMSKANLWTSEMALDLPEGLIQDWYEITLEGHATNDGFYLTDFKCYGD